MAIRRTFMVIALAATLIATTAVPAAAGEDRTRRVSVSSTSEQGNTRSGFFGLAISGNGRDVAFESMATNLVPGDTNDTSDVFVRDVDTRATSRASVSSAGVQGNDLSGFPAINGNGRHVAFASLATNLVPGDTNGQLDVFVRDRQAHTTSRVSLSSTGAQANDNSFNPSISANGRRIAFYSDASNLVPDDANGAGDVFVRDLHG